MTTWTTAAAVLLLSVPAHAGDLWLRGEQLDDDGSRLTLNIPANFVLTTTDDTVVDTADGQLDLKVIAKGLAVGESRRFRVNDDDGPLELTLSHEKRRGKPATGLALAIEGPLGKGLSMSLPLDGGAASFAMADAQLDAGIDIDGLDLDIDGPFLDQLRGSAPFTLIAATGPDGNTLRIATE